MTIQKYKEERKLYVVTKTGDKFICIANNKEEILWHTGSNNIKKLDTLDMECEAVSPKIFVEMAISFWKKQML